MLVMIRIVLIRWCRVRGFFSSYVESSSMLMIFRCEVVNVGLIGVCCSRFI